QDMQVEIDEAVLKDIANMTGGKYFRATNNEKLLEIYKEIDQMEKSKVDVRQFKIRDEKFMLPAIIAICLLILEMILRNTIFKNLV
ncbi:MAG: aerotolerance regulator BatA, partial [Bacteroidales bacterium]